MVPSRDAFPTEVSVLNCVVSKILVPHGAARKELRHIPREVVQICAGGREEAVLSCTWV